MFCRVMPLVRFLRPPIRMIGFVPQQRQFTGGERQLVKRSIPVLTCSDAKCHLRVVIRPGGPKDRIGIARHLRDSREVRIRDEELPVAGWIRPADECKLVPRSTPTRKETLN